MYQLMTTLLNLDRKFFLLTIICVIILYNFIKLYFQVFKLPPGPLPVPIIGNILKFRGTKVHPILTINEFRHKYGPIFTLWFGSQSFVFVYDIEIAKHLFHRIECSGRPKSFIGEILLSNKSNDIVFADYSESLVLRNVALSSARILSKSTDLLKSMNKLVDLAIQEIIEKYSSKPFSPKEPLYDLNLKIFLLAISGQIYKESNEDYQLIKHFTHEFMPSIVHRLGLWEFFPMTRIFDRKLSEKFQRGVKEFISLMNRILSEHNSNFNDNNIRDFCDAFIFAKRDSIRNNKWTQHLSDENITRSLFDLFLAGLETTHFTFQWILLLIAYYPEFQQNLRQEIDRQIGDTIPEYEDRDRCHYVMAFIAETIRFRNVNPLAIYHKTMADMKIDNYEIPKGTGFFVSQFSIMNDDKHWPNAQQFRPERFLSNGKYVRTRPNAYIPFGVGRRVCVGEKFAITHLFIMLVRFLQQTRDYTIELSTDSDFEPDSQQFFEFTPKYFEICLKRKIN